MQFDSRGREIPDPTPVAMPVGFGRPEPLADTIRRLVRTEVSRAAEAAGRETFEEADDFDVGDDYDPRSPWELSADQEAFREEATPDWAAKAREKGWKPPSEKTWEEVAAANGWKAPDPPPKPAVDPPVQGGGVPAGAQKAV